MSLQNIQTLRPTASEAPQLVNSSAIRERLCPQSDATSSCRVHLAGACGSGMKALIDVLSDAEFALTGSDSSHDDSSWKWLSSRGVTPIASPEEWSSSENCDLLVYSPALAEGETFRQAAQQSGIPQLSYVEAVAKILNPSRGIAVCGTHGKSSTTSLLSHLMSSADLSLTSFCGAQRCADGRSGRLGQSDIVIAEACEYRQHFLKLHPRQICLLGIEADHFDCYPVFDDAVQAYTQFLHALPPEGTLIVNWDCPVSRALGVAAQASSGLHLVSYSLNDAEADWTAQRTRTEIRILRKGVEVLTSHYQLPGRHALQNLLAAVATFAQSSRVDERLTSAIASYRGLKRRFEILSRTEKRILVDDFAHHPTEIRATLKTARENFPEFRIVCCFQPHQVSRTRALFDDFVNSLQLADEVLILPVFAAREITSSTQWETSQQLAAAVSNAGKECHFCSSLDPVRTRLETTPQTQELFITMGAGNLAQIHNDRTRSIQ